MLRALALVLAASIPVAAPSVSSIELGDLVRRSDYVVVARVDRVVRVARSEPAPPLVTGEENENLYDWDRRLRHKTELPVARLTIERVLEGPPDLKAVHFLARGTWVCDITGAKDGERGLDFLSEDAFETSLPGFVGAIRETTGGTPFCRVMHAGRGRMTLVGDPTIERVECWDDVELPKELVAASGQDARDSFIHHVPLSLLEKEVRAHVAQRWPHMRVVGPRRGTAAADWSLDVWGDGGIEAWIGVEHGRWPQIAPDAEKAGALARRFEGERFLAVPDALGVPDASARSIRIELRTSGRWKRVEVGGFGDAPTDELARALRLYADARALIDDRDASDDRPRIRESLRRGHR